MAAEQITNDTETFKSLPTPQTVLLFSGKRKSGKDFITNILHERIDPGKSVIIKLSGPIKSHWSKSLNLDIDQLLGDGQYKEKYRLEMAKWGENVRRKDYGYFCRAAIDMYNAHDKPIWIISDVRRKTDIQWFTEKFGDACKMIRVTSNDLIRKQRGWVFTAGIDDSETECDLDGINKWDLEIQNNGDNIDDILEKILNLIK